MTNVITSADEAIDRLGGPRKVGKMLKPPVAERAVGNWRVRGFPSHRYPEIRRLLMRRQIKFTLDVFSRMGNGKP